MKISSFRGLNNVSDPMRLGMEWLVQADNINITDRGAITKREGYSLAQAGSFSSLYSTIDFSRLYAAKGGAIRNFVGDELYSLTSTAPLYWCEINEQVFFNNGTDDGIILGDDEVLPWRRTGLADIRFLNVAGEGVDPLFNPLPTETSVIQHWKGRVYAAQYMPTENQTVIWFSEPLGYHLYDLDDSFFLVAGKVEMLAPTADALVVGTDARVYAYDGTKIEALADYGVVPGQHWASDENRILFWSRRGLCAALPFQNLTEKQVSVAPGIRAGGCVVRTGGQKRYLSVIQQGDSPFNAY